MIGLIIRCVVFVVGVAFALAGSIRFSVTFGCADVDNKYTGVCNLMAGITLVAVALFYGGGRII